MEKQTKVTKTDTELLNWFEEHDGCGLISDDCGHWAVSGDGMQNIPENTPADIQITFFIEKKKWKKNVREAIEASMKEFDC